MAAALAHASDHLLVGQHRSQRRAPIDRSLRLVGEAMRVAVGSHGGIAPRRDVGGDRQFGDRTPLLERGIEPGVEEDQEDPLRPADILRIGGGQFPLPVVAEAEHLQLATEGVDVALRALAGRSAGANGILLRRESEGVEPHRVHHACPPHPLETGDDVGGRVTFGMPHVQPIPAGVGEHVEDVGLAGAGEARAGERVVRIPPGLPLRFDPRGLVAGHEGFQGRSQQAAILRKVRRF